MSGNKIFLDGSVGMSFWGEDYFTPTMVRDALAGCSGPITVHLNSGGGIAADGLHIYTMLKDYPDAVTVIVESTAMSAASLIAMAGDRIVMRLGAFMMIHDPANPWTEGRGTEADHAQAAAQLAVVSRSFAAVYADKAAISVDDARAIMQAETYFDGPAAVEAGFATECDGQTKAVAAARFDYRIYTNSPAALRAGCDALGDMPSHKAVMAMFAGLSRFQEKEPTMAGTKATAGDSADINVEAESGVAIETPETEATKSLASETTVASGAAAERKRVTRLLNSATAAGLPVGFAVDHIAKGTSETAFLDAIIAKKQESDLDQHTPGRATASVGRDAREKFMQGATLALIAKSGMPKGERNEFSSMTMSELARESLLMAGVSERFADKRDMIGRAFTMDGAGAMTTSDFASILANVMGKAAVVGWEEAEETFPEWTRKGVLSDFKPSRRVGVGVFSTLPAVPEGANYTYGSVQDRGENITLLTYGRIARISRQAVINDDLSMLGDIPRRMGRAAKRTIGNLVYGVLTGNPVMSDAVALFNAAHGNLAGTSGAPSVATLGAAKAAMRVQSDNGSALNILPKYLIVPAALEATARQIITSTVDPTLTRGMAINPVNGMATIIIDARLDAASTTAWYMAADPSSYDTIEVAYLDGNDTPYIEQQQAWTADGVEMKVRIDAGVAPLDWRTMYRNAG